MDPGSSDTGGIAGNFVDVDGMRRGVYRFEVLRTFTTRSDKAALGQTIHLDIHSNAGDIPIQVLLPEVERMSRSRQISDGEAERRAKRAYPHLHSVSVEEESRLLGHSVKDDPEAVSIAKPRTRHGHMLGKIVPGGPQPRNTLSRPASASGPVGNRKTASNFKGRPQHVLAVEIHKGSNVDSVPKTKEWEETLPTPPSAKRRKLDRRASPASSDQTDPLDQISPHAMSFHTSQDASQPAGGAPSASVVSQGAGPSVRRSGSFEYRKVEQMMDSKPKSKKQRHHENRHYQADHVLLPSSPPKRSSMSNPIDISADESQSTNASLTVATRPTYRVTARQPPSTRNETLLNASEISKERANLTQSPYFEKYRLTTNRANGDVKQEIITQTSKIEDSPDLARKFIATDGRRRGSDVNVSSDADEIQSAPTTVGQNADPDAVFTVRKMRSNSPSKQSSSTLKASTPTDDLATCAPSTIKSDLASLNAKSRGSGRPNRPASCDQEAEPPWSIALAAISLPGRLFKDVDLGLVYDQKEKEYIIQRQGSTIRSTHSSLRIRPQKLVKVLWENPGKKVRLESSRSGAEDNILDLELENERDVSALLQEIQVSKALSVIGKPSEYMKKIFEKRRSELLRTLQGGATSFRPEEIIIITTNRQHNDPSRDLATLNAEKASRLRQRPSIVDELVLSATHNADIAALQCKIPRPAMPNGLPGENGLDELLAKLKPTHNEHLNLRRSTRDSAAHDGEGLLSYLDGVPEVEKYSVKHGLGEPWRKPLTYPKVGKKKTTVEWSDLERLDEAEFLNDNLISFYLRYLEQRLEEERPELAKKVYFFNTFFFATLTSAHKGKKRFNYEGVQKWTRSVDLFTYDYIIVPINEQAHWYLAIICNLPALDRDLAMPEERASSPTEDGKGTPNREPKRSDEPASSATSQPDGNAPEIIEPIAKKPSERDTRTSFSQLSLESDVQSPAGIEVYSHKPGTSEGTQPASEDKEMLDLQIEDTMPEFPVSKEPEDHPATTKDQGDKNQYEGSKAAAKSRKSKRKSLPAPITKIDPRKPAIITFDSLGQPRGPTIRVLKDYLREEAKAKRGMEFEDSQIKGINAKRIPQQDNFSDCGVFLLGYVDTFLGLETDPKEFIAKTIQQTHGETDWAKLVPGHLRASIRDQVRELHDIQTNERREESAKKPGKTAQRDDKQDESRSSHVPDHADTIRKESDEVNGAEGVAATKRKALEPSLLDIPCTNDGTLETAHHYEAEDFDKKNEMLEQLLRKNEREIQKSAERQRMDNSGTAEKVSNDSEAPAGSRDGLSVITVESQSQRIVSGPTGDSCPSFPPEKQTYSKSTSSSLSNPTLSSHKKDKSPELSIEIPDSQNSDTSRQVAKILKESDPVAPAAKTEQAPVASDFKDVPDDSRGGHGEGNERFKRRKTGMEDRIDIYEAPEKHDMIFTMEKPPERGEEHKEPSKRRKKPVKEALKNIEEVQIHVIDD